MRIAVALFALLLGFQTTHAAGWRVVAVVSPAVMSHDARPVLSIHIYSDEGRTAAGAVCSALVIYDDGKRPTSFRKFIGVSYAAPRSGVLTWRWHELSRASGGVAHVKCVLRGTTKTGEARFTIH